MQSKSYWDNPHTYHSYEKTALPMHVHEYVALRYFVHVLASVHMCMHMHKCKSVKIVTIFYYHYALLVLVTKCSTLSTVLSRERLDNSRSQR